MKVNSSTHITKDSQASKGCGRWTKEEHERFIDAIRLHGKSWKLVEQHIGTRNGAQIRSHAQKFFHRLKRDYQVDLSDTKSIDDKMQIERIISDFSESTYHSSKKHEELEKESSTRSFDRIEPETSMSLFAESSKPVKEAPVTEENEDDQKVLEIYNQMRRFLGQPENEFDAPTTPFKVPQSGFFNNFIKIFYSGQVKSEYFQDTKLSHLIEISDNSRDNTNVPNSPERESSTNSSKTSSFKPVSFNKRSSYMEEKLKLLRDAPAYEHADVSKRVKMASC